MMLVKKIQTARVMIIEQLESTDIFANKQLIQERVKNAVAINSARKEAISNMNQHQLPLSLALTHAWMGPVHW